MEKIKKDCNGKIIFMLLALIFTLSAVAQGGAEVSSKVCLRKPSGFSDQQETLRYLVAADKFSSVIGKTVDMKIFGCYIGYAGGMWPPVWFLFYIDLYTKIVYILCMEVERYG